MVLPSRHPIPDIRYPLTMPAEWEPHKATILAWPHNKEDWPDKFGPIPYVYGDIIRHLTRQERVRLLVRNEKEAAQAKVICKDSGAALSKIDIYIIPTDRIWMRDCGPIFVYKEARGQGSGVRDNASSPTSDLRPPASKIMLDWRFNAWAKYPNHKKDDKVPARLNERWKLPRIEPTHKGRRVVLEGGAIDVNGKGTLLTTEECLLSKVQERNPGFKREDYEEVFSKYLGISQIIWLGDGIRGDDTHGHVDDITRFVNPNTVVTVVEKNAKDGNHALLKDNLKRLKAARDQDGKPLNIVELPMPKPVYYQGQLLPASYANFLIANDIVLMPTFNDPADRAALSILAELFPGREIIGIHSLDLVWGLGTLHCMSQQEPA